MGLISFILALVALLLTIVAFFPFLGWLNWVFIPVTLLALATNILFFYVNLGMKNLADAGIKICLVALVIGLLRLIMGKGFI
jgi:hypothetical protein